MTELTGISDLVVLGSGYALTPVAVTLPEAVNDDLERYEGMLVTINGPLTAAQNFFQGRYGQVTLSAGGRMETPTNRHRPGAAAQALADLNARSRIILDDGTSLQNPNPIPYIGTDNTLRAGDVVASVTGVVDYGLATSSNAGFGDYKLHPTEGRGVHTQQRAQRRAAGGGRQPEAGQLQCAELLHHLHRRPHGRRPIGPGLPAGRSDVASQLPRCRQPGRVPAPAGQDRRSPWPR